MKKTCSPSMHSTYEMLTAGLTKSRGRPCVRRLNDWTKSGHQHIGVGTCVRVNDDVFDSQEIWMDKDKCKFWMGRATYLNIPAGRALQASNGHSTAVFNDNNMGVIVVVGRSEDMVDDE